MVKALSVRLPQALTKALDQVAEVVDRPRSYLIRKAVEAYLVEYADYQVALDRLRDKDDPILSSHELKTRLGV
ncbi:MAG: DNA-binding protein [Omnitrophica WOR_2 bacterium RIFCSPHIGHO2_02_FULL_68_15]|nr:MAG: DNA-binding protein [Omnitrophica WOR_2 bacterium RIFCSPHIGHO2_02_FULL_68_15]